MHLSRVKTENQAARFFLLELKNNNKNCREMGLLSLSNLAMHQKSKFLWF